MQPQPFSFAEIQQLPQVIKSPEFITADDGIKLAYYSFLPSEQPKTIVIFYHGGGIYTNNVYKWVGQTFAQASGFGIYLVDIRGHGNSQGPRGDASSKEQVWRDVQTMVNFVKQKNPQADIFLAGHSSGAALLLNYNSYLHPQGIKGFIFIAPYLGLSAHRHNIPAHKRFAKARTWLYILSGITNDRLFAHIPALFFNYPPILYEQDPLILRYYTCAMSKALTPLDPRKSLAEIHIPLWTYLGQEDEQFDPMLVKQIMASAPVTTSTFELLPNTNHLGILLQTPQLMMKAMTGF